jgi:hypothetical protein
MKFKRIDGIEMHLDGLNYERDGLDCYRVVKAHASNAYGRGFSDIYYLFMYLHEHYMLETEKLATYPEMFFTFARDHHVLEEEMGLKLKVVDTQGDLPTTVKNLINQGHPVLVPHMANLFEKYVSNNEDDAARLYLVKGYYEGGGAFLVHDGGTTDFFRTLKILIPQTLEVQTTDNVDTADWLVKIDGADIMRLTTDWTPSSDQFTFDFDASRGVPLHWITGSVYTEHLLTQAQLIEDHERYGQLHPANAYQVITLESNGMTVPKINANLAIKRARDFLHASNQVLPDLMEKKVARLTDKLFLGNRLGLAQVKSQRIAVLSLLNLLRTLGTTASQRDEIRTAGLYACTLWKDYFKLLSIAGRRSSLQTEPLGVHFQQILNAERSFIHAVLQHTESMMNADNAAGG